MKNVNKNTLNKYEPETFSRCHILRNKLWSLIACGLLVLVNMNQVAAQNKFEAVGPTSPVKHAPMEVGAIKVTFDLLPTTVSYDLPWTFWMISENGLKFCNYPCETYDPRNFFGTGGAASFEPGMDKEGRYVRVWIEHQSDARIVVRVRYPLANNLYDIAHTDIPSGSPYGKGDWVDEWHYYYPDGIKVQHIKMYTGLAPEARPFGFDRTPPKMVTEFIESILQGPVGVAGLDVMDTAALTLIRLIGNHSETRFPVGKSTKISYLPYPNDYGDFRDANIMLYNLKSKYKPFTIAMPYGVRAQPYAQSAGYDFFRIKPRVNPTANPTTTPAANAPATPTTPRPPRGWTGDIGHLLNYQFYRRDGNTLEQVYLNGWTNAADPVQELSSLAWSWIQVPVLTMEGVKASYTEPNYDPAQKAYIIPRGQGRGPLELKFSLEFNKDPALRNPLSIYHPVFIVKDWGTGGVTLTVDGKVIQPGKEFRIGYEDTPTGTDLIMWLMMTASQPTQFTISPVSN